MNKLHQYGYYKVATAVPAIKVAHVNYNKNEIIKLIKQAVEEGVSLLVFPELCLTGATCGDLFLQPALTDACQSALKEIGQATAKTSISVVLGSPVLYNNRLYNCACVLGHGYLQGLVPKQLLSRDESKYFSVLAKDVWEDYHQEGDFYTSFSNRINFYGKAKASYMGKNEFGFTIEMGQDYYHPLTPSSLGPYDIPNIIVNPSADPSLIQSLGDQEAQLKSLSAKSNTVYIHVNAGYGESTTHYVYAGQSLIFEAGTLVHKGQTFTNQSQLNTALVDLEKVALLRQRQNNKYGPMTSDHIKDLINENNINCILYGGEEKEPSTPKGAKPLLATLQPFPFIPEDAQALENNCQDIINLTTSAMIKRFCHVNNASSLIGVSGGLDSTLALLLLVEAYHRMGKPVTEIIGVRMPGFGTSGSTYHNSVKLMDLLGIRSREVDIKASVTQHLKDISHPLTARDTTYENAQARERTQILMDIANQTGGLVIGTGDLSELALGFCTFNGDHMSMYAVNGSIPKTLIPYVIRSLGRTYDHPDLIGLLENIIDTPISPELLPPSPKQMILQKTEDLIGPYALHDFFLYHMVRYGFRPSKIRALASQAFAGVFSYQEVDKWIRVFYRRFFAHQFKRNCLPDGPVLGRVSLFANFQMPSDAQVSLWLADLENE